MTVMGEPGGPSTYQSSDSQVTEILGRNHLLTELVRSGIEVALPLRDHGVDVIAYVDIDADLRRFVGCPIQMKAATTSAFSLDVKYQKFNDMLIAYVWHVNDPALTVTYALTYGEACSIVEAMGWTATASWKDEGRYAVTRAEQNAKLMQLLAAYQMTPEKWRAKITGITTASLETETVGTRSSDA